MSQMNAARKVIMDEGAKPWKDRGVTLTHGTSVRIEHRGRVFHGQIKDGQWCVIDEKGKEHCATSPSAAATFVCKTEDGKPASINGWLHWEVRVGRLWIALDEFRPTSHR